MPHTKSVLELSQMLRNKQISSVELTQHFLNRIEKFNPQINAFITTNPQQSLLNAKLADEKISKAEQTSLSLLTGIPIAQKDIFCAKNWRTTCGSKMLENFIAPYNATVINKLENIAGMVSVGKTNMDEFAMGSSNETSYFGNVKNPFDLQCVPGGSSGGSAAAVAARMAPIATGTDTGGSIRQPASLCSLTGLKPTYGLVSRYGMIAFASSLDQAGPMGQSAADCALLLDAMLGFDERDSTSLPPENADYQKIHENLKNIFENTQNNGNLNGLKIGLPTEFFGDKNTENCDPEILQAIENAKQELQKLGAEFVEISLPHIDLSVAAYYVLAPAEASSNLSRYDGVRYGYRSENYENLEQMYERTRAEGFGKEVKRRILIGTYVLSHGYYDAYYLQAQKIRRLIANDFVEAFKNCDVILSPTSPSLAFKIGEKSNNPVQMYLSDIYTIGVNLAGLPGMSLPCGFSKSGLPIGMQLIGNYFDEAKLLNTANIYQNVTDFHKQLPRDFA